MNSKKLNTTVSSLNIYRKLLQMQPPKSQAKKLDSSRIKRIGSPLGILFEGWASTPYRASLCKLKKSKRVRII